MRSSCPWLSRRLAFDHGAQYFGRDRFFSELAPMGARSRDREVNGDLLVRRRGGKTCQGHRALRWNPGDERRWPCHAAGLYVLFGIASTRRIALQTSTA